MASANVFVDLDEDEEAELFDEDNGETERLEDSDDNSQNSNEPDEFTEYLLGQGENCD